MGTFWQKSIFWVIFFAILIAIIPIVSYLFKESILSILPSSLVGKTKSVKIAKPGKCLVLEDQYCSKAKMIDWTNPKGEKTIMIGVSLPAGVSLLMPIDGQVAKVKLADDGVFKGLRASVFDPNQPNKWYVFNGDLQFDNMFSLNMKKGETFGRTQKTGIENAGKYNLLFYIVTGAGRDAFIAEDEMKGMFQAARL